MHSVLPLAESTLSAGESLSEVLLCLNPVCLSCSILCELPGNGDNNIGQRHTHQVPRVMVTGVGLQDAPAFTMREEFVPNEPGLPSLVSEKGCPLSEQGKEEYELEQVHRISLSSLCSNSDSWNFGFRSSLRLLALSLVHLVHVVGC